MAAAITWSLLLLPICTAAFIVLSGLDPFHPVRWISSRCPTAFCCFCSHVFVFLGFFFYILLFWAQSQITGTDGGIVLHLYFESSLAFEMFLCYSSRSPP